MIICDRYEERRPTVNGWVVSRQNEVDPKLSKRYENLLDSKRYENFLSKDDGGKNVAGKRAEQMLLTRLLTSQSQPHSVRVDPAPTIAAYHTEKVTDNIIVT